MSKLDTVICRQCRKPYLTVGIPGTCPACLREHHKAFEHDAKEAAEVNAFYGYTAPSRVCDRCGEDLNDENYSENWLDPASGKVRPIGHLCCGSAND
jgi:uncharacterized protein (DUF983 family)